MNAPPGKRKPGGGRAVVEPGQQARHNSTPTRPFVVIAITRHGRRIPAGRFDSLETAEQSCAILRELAMLTGGNAIVERVRAER